MLGRGDRDSRRGGQMEAPKRDSHRHNSTKLASQTVKTRRECGQEQLDSYRRVLEEAASRLNRKGETERANQPPPTAAAASQPASQPKGTARTSRGVLYSRLPLNQMGQNGSISPSPGHNGNPGALVAAEWCGNRLETLRLIFIALGRPARPS